MASISEIIDFINSFLEVDKFDDVCLNGLQVEGKNDINKIVTGVSVNLEFLNKAAEKKADLVLVHHGLFLGKDLFKLTGFLKERVKFLLEHDLNLAVYHLPLDAHKTLGNASLILQKLDAKVDYPIEYGWMGSLKKDVDFETFVYSFNDKLGFMPKHVEKHKDSVKYLAVVTGNGVGGFVETIEKGVDTFISGEIKEPIPAIAKELSANFIALGHYNSEKFGIKALGEYIARKFGVECEFVSVPNSV